MAPAIEFENVGKNFTIRQTTLMKDALLGIAGHREKSRRYQALTNVSFTVEEGDSVALLGHNGSGKSTALKLLAGVFTPSTGLIRAKGRMAALLELGSGFHSDLTGRENVYLNGAILRIPRKEVDRRFDEIVAYSEVEEFLDTPVKFYSSGMLVRLGFSIAVCLEPEILLLDEVLGVGDADFQQKSLGRVRELRDEGRTIVLVTHNWATAREFCSQAVVLDHGCLTYDGDIVGAEEAFRASARGELGGGQE